MSDPNRQCGSQPDANQEQQHSQQKPTPGEWKYNAGARTVSSEVWPTRRVIARYVDANNASLIIAAPAMYEALTEALRSAKPTQRVFWRGSEDGTVSELVQEDTFPEWHRIGSAAIAKAQGGAL